MINLLLAVARIAAEAALSSEAVVARTAVGLARKSIIRQAGKAAARRTLRRGVRRMGVLDAAVSGIRRGASTLAETQQFGEPPTRILPPLPVSPSEMPSPGIPAERERIQVPPGAYPSTPVSGTYFQSNRFTQNIFNANAATSPGPTPPPSKPVEVDPKLNNLIKADIASNLLNTARGLADKWLPGIGWTGSVSATGYKTTPTRTVIHYALAVVFGLIKQQRLSSCSLVVNVDYETNHVHVVYVSQAYWLTEILTMSLYAATKTFPPALTEDYKKLGAKILDQYSRSVISGINPFGGGPGIVEMGKGLINIGGDALKLILKSYQAMGRMLGPLGVYDMGDETLYGGRASALLRAPFQPQPFASMQADPDGKPVPLLTRLPAPNPHPPVAQGTDPASGYSLDLRSLVAQTLYDPGITPPVPDTNVSLPAVY